MQKAYRTEGINGSPKSKLPFSLERQEKQRITDGHAADGGVAKLPELPAPKLLAPPPQWPYPRVAVGGPILASVGQRPLHGLPGSNLVVLGAPAEGPRRPGRGRALVLSVHGLLTRIAANIAKLPELLRKA